MQHYTPDLFVSLHWIGEYRYAVEAYIKYHIKEARGVLKILSFNIISLFNRARNQWLDDETLTLDRLAKKRHLLYMPSDGSNTLKVEMISFYLRATFFPLNSTTLILF